ncbi:MAG: PA domain-containing protein [Acidobacteriota bacterium]
MTGSRISPRTAAIGAALSLLCAASAAHALPVRGTVGVDPNARAGTDGQGRVLLYTPNPAEGGSSLSHWDLSASPDLLMEPSASPNVPFQALDLTRQLMLDIGWQGGSSTMNVRYTDPAGQGFNDNSLGATRRQAIEFAVNTWANTLRSSVPINVDVSFSDLPCSNGTGVLAQAGPDFIFENFANAPVGGTFYPGALAEALSGTNLSLQDIADPNAGDLSLVFNSRIDEGCLGGGSSYYYGLNGNGPGNTINFITVALHEMAHGLGFASFVNEQNGALFLNTPDIYTRNMRDNTLGQLWHTMTNSQRATSARNTGNVVWNGNRVTQSAPSLLALAPSLIISEPASVAGRFQISTAAFGPPVQNPGITGLIVRALDSTGSPTLACASLVNGSEVSGAIALVDRGTCNFTEKVRNAQNAGARAVVVVNNVPGAPITMGGDDASIVIPAVMVSQADGQRIKNALDEEPPNQPGTLSLGQTSFSISEGAGTLDIAVLRSNGDTGAVSVDYATSSGTATAGLDFTAATGTVEFADGEDGTKTFSIGILNDDEAEDQESFTVTLSNPQGGANLGAQVQATVTLSDDEPCVSTPTVVCLNDGRFTVRVTWRDFEGNVGDGRQLPFDSPDSALLWFFTADNWELLVKVLNGCGFNNRYWVFAAATTNVEYTLRVTDTQTGAVQEYTNPLGVSSAAVTDTNAFATCP